MGNNIGENRIFDKYEYSGIIVTIYTQNFQFSMTNFQIMFNYLLSKLRRDF
jgi:hypothetical protein